MDTEYQDFLKRSYSVTLPSLALVMAGPSPFSLPLPLQMGSSCIQRGARASCYRNGTMVLWNVVSTIFPCDCLAPKSGGKTISLLSDPIYPPQFFFQKRTSCSWILIIFDVSKQCPK